LSLAKDVTINKTGLYQAYSTFYAVRATSAKFGLQAGSKEFKTQNEE
jgi:hypothetical protein